jgi:hypothetical protein
VKAQQKECTYSFSEDVEDDADDDDDEGRTTIHVTVK